jgi:hypothetical protein
MSRPPKPPSTRTRVKRPRALSVRRGGDDAADGERSESGRLLVNVTDAPKAEVSGLGSPPGAASVTEFVLNEKHFSVDVEVTANDIAEANAYPGGAIKRYVDETFSNTRMENIDAPIEHFTVQSIRRERTILLVEGIDEQTQRKVRAYVLPSGRYVVVETVGGMG